MTPDLPETGAGSGRVELALAPSVRLRLLGSGLAAVGVAVALVVAAVAVLDVPPAVGGGVVALGGVGVVVLGLTLGVRRWVLRLDEHGYRVRGIRTEARSARWTDVLDLQAVDAGPTRGVVLRLRDGRTTALPVDSIEGGAAHLTKLLTAHLDRGHGYRRLQ